ncbi:MULTISPECIES: hypothetical protein [unclassified Nonomuraea]|uniref:hypothetical protein n=1 Tax=unclassified Nonomuraea TaxID=2593643 RepID=UPI0034069AA3
MLVILAIAALAILACVVLVSLGRGGELTEFPPDVPPLDLPEATRLTAVDFMALQLPVNLVGYHTQSVDETLRRAASAISARDTRIAVLEQRVSELMSSRLHARQELYASPGGAPRTDHEPDGPAELPSLPEDGDPVAAQTDSIAVQPEPTAVPAAEVAPAEEPGTSAADDVPADAGGVPAGPQPEPRLGEKAAHTGEETADPHEETADPREEVADPRGKAAGTREEPVRAVAGKDGDERA